VEAPDGSLATPHGAQEEVNTLYSLPNNNNNNNNNNNKLEQGKTYKYLGIEESEGI
jgi:hypothetical protein